MKFRHLNSEDKTWEEILKVFPMMYEEMYGDKNKSPLDLNSLSDWFDTQKKIAGKNSSFITLYNDLEKFIGFIHISQALLPSYYKDRAIGFVHHLYVIPEYRKNNCANSLFNEAELWFSKKGLKKINLQVLPDNEVALEFWKSKGFETNLIQMNCELSG